MFFQNSSKIILFYNLFRARIRESSWKLSIRSKNFTTLHHSVKTILPPPIVAETDSQPLQIIFSIASSRRVCSKARECLQRSMEDT